MKKVVLKRSEGGSAGAENNNTIRVVNYRECRRNLAVRTGGHAVDGCREFIPSTGAEETAALTCASCGCHRSFHRREEHVLPAA